MSMSWAFALLGCTTALPQHSPAPQGISPTAASPAGSARAGPAPLTFPRLEGIYRQPGRSFVVTYQGWWLDLTSQQIRQLTPADGGTFTYGPGWQDPAPVQGDLHFSTDAAGIPVTVTGIAPGQVPVDAVRVPITERSVRFPSQGAVLAGTLSSPSGPGSHPGIVILQGSGPLDRHFESISQEIYLSFGFAVLAFDKRGVAASTGVFPGELATPEVIGIQATDAAAAARFMMGQPGVDPRQVGFDGNSQGGWVAPLAAERVPAIKFEILIASPSVTSDQQGVYAGFSDNSQDVPSQSQAVIDRAVTQAAGGPGYDPAPALASLHIPVLWIYGQLD